MAANMTRLRLPLRFRSEADALAAIEAASLFPYGAKARPGEGGRRWFICIDTPRPEMTLKFLRAHTCLGADWTLAPTIEASAP
jgi:hypothetical protein